jgi:2-methylisocitrate lyase-like PEP mutase family enzyme
LPTARVVAAADAAHRRGLIVTARSENDLHAMHDVDDSTARLTAYRRVGADVLYAPGLIDTTICRLVEAVTSQVKRIRSRDAPAVDELAAAGVRRCR